MKNVLDINKNEINLFSYISFFLIVIGVRLHFIAAYGSSVPYWDDWGMGGFVYQHLNNELGWLDYFTPANEHRMVFARIINVLFFDMNQQQWDPMLMMVVNSIIWSVSGFMLIYIANKYSDRIKVTLIFFIVLVIWTFPISPVNTLWGIQSHNYLMILFAILGCWLIGKPVFSLKWFVGLFCLFASCLTLAGGSFVGISVAVTYVLVSLVDRSDTRSSLITAVSALLAGIFGLILIFTQESGNNNFDFILSAKIFLMSMSWPMPRQIWPSLLLVIPVIILAHHVLTKQKPIHELSKFIFSLYGFIFLTSLGIAYARAEAGTTRRYFEFLSLAFIASTYALLYIQNKWVLNASSTVKSFLIILWVLIIVASVPFQIGVMQYTLYDRSITKPHQAKNVHGYLSSNDSDWLENKLFRQVPYTKPKVLGEFLTAANSSDILPYQVQTPDKIAHIPSPDLTKIEKNNNPFIPNGIYIASKNILGEKYKEQIGMGSYHPKLGREKATGKYMSATFEINRPYVMIPIIGYVGYENMSLKLVDSISKEEFEVTPVTHSKYSEVWRDYLMKVPRGYYHIEAIDNNPNLWFGFTQPRSVGRFSYYTQGLLSNAKYIWQLGIFLLIISLRYPIVNAFQVKNEK